MYRPESYLVKWEIRVWRRTAQGDNKEITSGEPVAVVERSQRGGGLQSATWTCPEIVLSPTDSIIVRGLHVVRRWLELAARWNARVGLNRALRDVHD